MATETTETTETIEKLYNLDAAMAYLGCSISKLYRLVKAGKLKTVTNELDLRERLISASQLDKLKPVGEVIRAA